MANPTTNFGWVMPTSSSLVTNLPADFNTFGQAVDTSMSELLGGTTGQVLSKTSNTNMDFTWVTPTDQTPLTTKGDLFTFTTVDARLGVGANGTILTADSTAASGLAWAAPAAGGGITLISTTSFSGSSITLSSIPTTYKNLYLEITGVYGSDTYQDVNVRFNGDTGSNYDWGKQGSQNSGTDVSNSAAATSFQIVNSGTNSGASEKSSAILTVFNYAQTSVPVIFTSFGRGKQDTNLKSSVVNGQYRNSANVTSITFLASSGTFSAGSVKLYGVN